MQCQHCGRGFQSEDRAASISGSIMGDEHTDTFFLCPACNFYSVENYWDNFTGLESVSASGPLSREEGDDRVQLIRQCSRPWDKKCRCAAHTAYFRGSLD